jgi:hypothetical protein
MTKQFKIGEYAIGGIIKVSKTKGQVIIQALDWNTKKPVRSDFFYMHEHYRIHEYLNELTSCYYADKLIDYIYFKN